MSTVSFASDYQEGTQPYVLERMASTNFLKMPGYGTDEICVSARERIRRACACADADVHFLVGGTQTNATVLDALLAAHEGVIAADTGHISVHEAGAIEAGGHKVITLPHRLGKVSAAQLGDYCDTFFSDLNHDHMVAPGVVYVSQPTEYGTLYSLSELESIRDVCCKHGLRLYVDGARLAYALGSAQNDVGLPDLARLCDAFYIGGTKCGALFGEAVVIPDPQLTPHFFTLTKQHGALLAKGWLLGIQFDELFAEDRYLSLGKPAVEAANRIRAALVQSGHRLAFVSPTNQVFVVLKDAAARRLGNMVEYSFWERYDKDHIVIRLATSWATTDEQVNQLLLAFSQL